MVVSTYIGRWRCEQVPLFMAETRMYFSTGVPGLLRNAQDSKIEFLQNISSSSVSISTVCRMNPFEGLFEYLGIFKVMLCSIADVSILVFIYTGKS